MTRVSGFHIVRPVVKLADGTWLVGDYGEGAPSSNSTLFLQSEFAVANVRWLPLDIARVVRRGSRMVEKPDLSKVDEIGFADLLRAAVMGGGASSTWENRGLRKTSQTTIAVVRTRSRWRPDPSRVRPRGAGAAGVVVGPRRARSQARIRDWHCHAAGRDGHDPPA